MSEQSAQIKKWGITTVVSMLGGGAAAAFAALTDPAKYSFPADFGSGKLWKYVFMGWGLTLAGILIKSPLGQKAIAITQQSKEQLAETQQQLNDAKAAMQQKQKGKP